MMNTLRKKVLLALTRNADSFLEPAKRIEFVYFAQVGKLYNYRLFSRVSETMSEACGSNLESLGT